MKRAAVFRGFTLIEMIMVIMVLSIAAVSVLEAFSGNGRGLLIADNNHIAQNMAQQCAEYIVRAKRDLVLTYANINTTVCNSLPVSAGFSPPTVTPTSVTSATVTACPASTACKDTTIVVTKSGVTLATMRLLLVDY